MKLAKYVKFRAEKFGGVLFETRSEKVYTLNPTATAVIRALESGAAPSEIADRIKAEFQGNAVLIEQEINALLADLRGKGLVED
jgi:hypothetical protein